LREYVGDKGFYLNAKVEKRQPQAEGRGRIRLKRFSA
jgi:hypothetical protein